ncbi:MAG TPA: FAD-dependent oxidoreductase [Terriglobales bacterium]|nr:FAD-dependent oxidoreductase [Terriglobales bacterium]
MPRTTADTLVIGAGVFGAWTALALRRAGHSVLLVDAYGPGNSRASSGGETRIIRTAYGADELYTRWAIASLARWKQLAEETRSTIFLRTGVLWLADDADAYSRTSFDVVKRNGVAVEEMKRAELARRYPQFALDDVTWGFLEGESGVLMARRGVRALVERAAALGVEFRQAAVEPPGAVGRLDAVRTRDGHQLSAGTYLFACGPWLPRLFPELLGARIFPTRQEVFFFGAPAGDTRFRPPAMPTWLRHAEDVYGMPDVENRGVKISLDRHGEAFDPDTGSRVVSQNSADAMRAVVARRLPALANAPIVETRVCQYENTSSGDFLIDRHPEWTNVWLVGGGSGHGFKHGPMVGEYVASTVAGSGAPEPRFALAAKKTVRARAVY